MILPIYLYGSQVLRAKAQDADLEKKEEILQLISDMKETMLNADGCGLAAPQVGVSQRIVIVDGSNNTMKNIIGLVQENELVNIIKDTIKYES